MFIDICCDRKNNKENKGEKAKTLNLQGLNDDEISVLFRNNTKIAPIDESCPKELSKSGLSKRTIERLKIEFRFLIHMKQMENVAALTLIGKYYNTQVCKSATE